MTIASILRLLAGLVLAYGALVALAWFFQSGLLYLRHVPGRELEATPAAIGLDYEEARIEASDGVRLHGWFVPAGNPRGTLLFFHGNAGNVSHRLDSIRLYHDLRLSVLILDYRGYGRSEGSPTEPGTRRDARAAWDYLVEQRNISPASIILFGRSLGAAVAAELARERQPGALILESAFTSVPDVAQEAYWYLPARWLSRFEYKTVDYVRQVSAPVLTIHSEDDEIIPYHHGQSVFEAANEPKRFLTLRGGHNTGFILSEAEYRQGIDAFLSEVAGLR
jgi:fermentation-respiration switch protein FrsA (DUF1100 family)